jgi:ADP-heptose:LPS heptosyltransferase
VLFLEQDLFGGNYVVDKELSKQGFVKYYSTKVARQLLRVYAKSLFNEKKVFDKKNVKTILFIQRYGIGDYLMSTPAINAIAKEFPKAKTILLCRKPANLVAELNPAIDKTIFDLDELKTKVDLVISLNDSVEGTILAKKTNAKYAIGFLNGECVKANFAIKKREGKYNLITNYAQIANAINAKDVKKEFVMKVTTEKNVDKLLKKHKLSKFIFLNPNTREGAEAKNWGNTNYAQLAEKVLAKGYEIIFCGAKGETDGEKTIRRIPNRKLGSVFDFTGKFSLKETTYLISKAKAYVGNDTGLMHIAIASKIPTIGLFGPTDSKRIFLSGKKRFAFQVQNKTWPRYLKGTFDIHANQKYMDQIKVNNVFEKLLEIV